MKINNQIYNKVFVPIFINCYSKSLYSFINEAFDSINSSRSQDFFFTSSAVVQNFSKSARQDVIRT